MVLPSGYISKVKEIWTLDGPLQEAFCPQSVTLVLDDDIDVSRGDMIVDPDDLPGTGTELHAKICWLHPQAVASRARNISSSTRRRPSRRR